MEDYPYPGLDSMIQIRLNKRANVPYKPYDFIIIQLNPPIIDGWCGGTFDQNNGWWHADNNQQLNVTQCNTYLTNYQGFLEYYQTTFVGGYGNDNMYVHHVSVYHVDGLTDCDPPPCPPYPPNSTIYCYHYMVFYYCQYIYNGDPQ